MPALPLTAAERRQHRAAAHHLHVVVTIGGDGPTEAVRREIDAALTAHGLVKVRVFIDDRRVREALLLDLAARLDAAPVQHIGKLFVLWRPKPERERARSGAAGAPPRPVRLVTRPASGTHRAMVRKVTLPGNQRVTAGGKIKRAKARRASVKKKAA